MLFFFFVLFQSNILQIDLHYELHTLLKDIGIIANSMVLQIKMLMWGFHIPSRIDWACYEWKVSIQPILLHFFRNRHKSNFFFFKNWNKTSIKGKSRKSVLPPIWRTRLGTSMLHHFFEIDLLSKILFFSSKFGAYSVVSHKKLRLRWKWIFRT